LQYLLEQGYNQVILEVKQRNHPAVSVYQAMGYKIINQEVILGRFCFSQLHLKQNPKIG
jgi:ribosomal protein S18 acetylase RimI-like enzyme